MDENLNNSLPMQECQQQPALWEKYWLVGLMLFGLLLALPGIYVLAQATRHPKDDWIFDYAPLPVTIGLVSIAVASVLLFIRTIPKITRSIPKIIRIARSWFIARRRWNCFSLRTLFVLVTLACLYLGWLINWNRQREAVLYQTVIFPLSPNYQGHSPHHRFIGSGGRAPLLLRPIGAIGIAGLILPDGTTDEELNRIRALFPEAEVGRIDY